MFRKIKQNSEWTVRHTYYLTWITSSFLVAVKKNVRNTQSQNVLQKLQSIGVTLNRFKCEEQLTFLGYDLDKDGIFTDPGTYIKQKPQ